MENLVLNADEIQRHEAVSKCLHKIKTVIDILFLCVLGFVALVGILIYTSYGLEEALEQMLAAALIASLPAFLFVCAWVGSSLELCYRRYRCKECGCVHKVKPEDLSGSVESLYCPNCNKKTKHKTMPLNK